MIKLGTYRHYKGGLYNVIGNAVHTETEEPLVIYHPLGEPSKMWARPEVMWNDDIDENTKRFTSIVQSKTWRCLRQKTASRVFSIS